MIMNQSKMSPEVLIYLQTIKQYFNTNEEAQEYFTLDKDKEDDFYTYIAELSQQNFDENGEPELTIFQFEEVKRKMSKLSDDVQGDITTTGVFISLGELGYVSLN